MQAEKTTWTSAMEAKLRAMAFGRSTVPEIAAAIGCSEAAVKNKAGKLALPLTTRIDERVRVRIVRYAKDGRRPTWIARQLGIHVEVVEQHAGVLTPA